MVLNLMGGCAMEVVSATSFKPVAASFKLELGDLGIFITQMKCPDVKKAFDYCKRKATQPFLNSHPVLMEPQLFSSKI